MRSVCWTLQLLLLCGRSAAFTSPVRGEPLAAQLGVSSFMDLTDEPTGYYEESTNYSYETLAALQELEEEKEEQVQALKLELFETLGSALRVKESEAQILQLNRLKMDLETRLQFQATTYDFEDELQVDSKAAELQALRDRLTGLKSQVEARARGPPVEKEDWLKVGFNDIKNIFQNTGTAAAPATKSDEKVAVKAKAKMTKTATPVKVTKKATPKKAGARGSAGTTVIKEVKKNKSPFVFGKK